jgi:hypothetical protein
VRCLKFSVAIAVVLASAVSLLPSAASADTGTRTKKGCVGAVCFVIGKASGDDRVKSGGRRSPAELPTQDHANSEEDERILETRKEFSAAFAEYDRRLASYNRCVLIFDPSLNNAGCGNAPTPPNTPEFRSGTFSGRGNQPIRITAGQAAAIAVARLQLPKIPPGIGPSPDINPWNMAAVGYPLWLWADGSTHVGPISDSVAGLSVSLEAEVSGLSFRMGDGHTVTCAGSGHPWTTAVPPGTKSPSCGYTYAEPSLPDNAYTVAAIANWAVTWTSNSQSGVINVPAVATTELPVGELQVLVR